MRTGSSDALAEQCSTQSTLRTMVLFDSQAACFA